MGWTWRYTPELLLQFPQLANIEALISQWPSLQTLKAEMEAKGLLPAIHPPADGGSNVPNDETGQ